MAHHPTSDSAPVIPTSLEEKFAQFQAEMDRRHSMYEQQVQSLIQQTETLQQENIQLRAQLESPGAHTQFGRTATKAVGDRVRIEYPQVNEGIYANDELSKSDSPHRLNRESRRTSKYTRRTRSRSRPHQKRSHSDEAISNKGRQPMGATHLPPSSRNQTFWNQTQKNPASYNLSFGVLINRQPAGTLAKRLDDMLSTPFTEPILNYEPPREFVIPKFTLYDGFADPFDHLLHYRQVMILDIANEFLMCKIFPASLHGSALSWFHRLPANSVGNFRDLSQVFVSNYLCSARQKQNVSTLQNLRMMETESLRDFVKRFGQAVLQVDTYSMDVVLQILRRSISPGIPFFKSIAKNPPTTMDDLYRRANKYATLEDDVRAASQHILESTRLDNGGTQSETSGQSQPECP